jgi:hypothetical protein
MNLHETQQALLALVVVVLLVQLLPAAFRYLAGPDDLADLLRCFQPRWKREAHRLAQRIPTGDEWGRA